MSIIKDLINLATPLAPCDTIKENRKSNNLNKLMLMDLCYYNFMTKTWFTIENVDLSFKADH